MKLLEKFGVKFKSVVEDCCGGLPDQMGLDYDASPALKAITDANVDIVVTGCPLCYRAIQRALPDIRVRHVLSVVADKIGADFKPLAGMKVAYHDPCLLGGSLGIYDLPREIIQKLGGELILLPRERADAPCCGAGGAVPEVDPDLALKIARGRIEEILAAQVTTLLTSCEECAEQLQKAVKDGEPLKVLTITEVMLKSQ